MRSTTRIDGKRAAAALAVPAFAFVWLAASPAAVVAPPLPPPEPPVAPFHQADPTAVPAPIPGSALGLILYGVSGGSTDQAAVIGSATVGQRLVRIGRDFQPGLKLSEVGPGHVVVTVAGGGTARLELRRFGAPSTEGAPGRSDSQKQSGIESAVLRNILKPIAANGRSGGYRLTGGESLPQLQKAGLRAGDVILSVNGSQLDPERMSELAWEMRNAARTEFVFVREGKRMRGGF